jgi:hypothetical protein
LLARLACLLTIVRCRQSVLALITVARELDQLSESTSPTLANRVGWVLVAVFSLTSALCIALEPIRHDGWYFWMMNRQREFALDSWIDFAKYTYLHNNPRFGEIATFGLYAPSIWAKIAQGFLLLLVVWSIAGLGLQRRPTRADGVYVATIVGLLLLVVPRVGPMLFYPPFFANYAVGFVPSTLLLWIWLRANEQSGPPSGSIGIVGTLLLSLLAGFGNEHLGPAVLFAGGCICWSSYRRGNLRWWTMVSLLLFGISWLLLLTAPGQMERSQGVGRVGILQTIFDRPVVDSLIILWRAPSRLFWTLPWLLVVVPWRSIRERWRIELCSRQGRLLGFALLLAAVIGCTVLGSPINEPALYYAPAILILTAVAAWAVVVVQANRQWWIIGINAAVIVVSCGGLLSTTWREHKSYNERKRQLLDAQPGTSLLVRKIPNGLRQWTFRDDFVDRKLTEALARHLGLTSIDFEKQ